VIDVPQQMVLLPRWRRLHSSGEGQVLVNAALEGMGILYEPDFLVYQAIKQNRLVQILEDWETDEFSLFAVFASRQFLPPKVRSFIDFLVEYFGRQAYFHTPNT